MNGWADPEPAWWLNLLAYPDATVDLVVGRCPSTDAPRTRTSGPACGPDGPTTKSSSMPTPPRDHGRPRSSSWSHGPIDTSRAAVRPGSTRSTAARHGRSQAQTVTRFAFNSAAYAPTDWRSGAAGEGCNGALHRCWARVSTATAGTTVDPTTLNPVLHRTSTHARLMAQIRRVGPHSSEHSRVTTVRSAAGSRPRGIPAAGTRARQGRERASSRPMSVGSTGLMRWWRSWMARDPDSGTCRESRLRVRPEEVDRAGSDGHLRAGGLGRRLQFDARRGRDDPDRPACAVDDPGHSYDPSAPLARIRNGERLVSPASSRAKSSNRPDQSTWMASGPRAS